MIGITKHKLVFLDSNVFIYHFEENPQFIPYTQLIFDNLSKGKFKAVTSILSIIEALSFPSPPAILKEIEKGFEVLPNLEVLEINHDIALKAAGIRRTYGIRLPDAIQLASALYAKADVFVTNDKKLRAFKHIKILLITSL